MDETSRERGGSLAFTTRWLALGTTRREVRTVSMDSDRSRCKVHQPRSLRIDLATFTRGSDQAQLNTDSDLRHDSFARAWDTNGLDATFKPGNRRATSVRLTALSVARLALLTWRGRDLRQISETNTGISSSFGHAASNRTRISTSARPRYA